MNNGHNNTNWEYAEQRFPSQTDENDYPYEDQDNVDDPYEIECNYMEEELEFDSNSEDFQAQHRLCPEVKTENGEETCSQYFVDGPHYGSETSPHMLSCPPCPETAPEFLGHQSSGISLLCHQEEESQESDEDYTEDEMIYQDSYIPPTKFLDCTNDCGSDGLEELIDTRDYETLVLYANYRTRNLNGPKEYYSSESEPDIVEYVAPIHTGTQTNQRRWNNYKFPVEVKSGHSLTTRHKGAFSSGNTTKEELEAQSLDPNLHGFGKQHVMRPLLTWKEQQMLGIIPKSVSSTSNMPDSDITSTPSHVSVRGPTRTRKGLNATPLREHPGNGCNISPSNNSTAKTLRKNDGMLRVESIKIVSCDGDDPAAAGDSVRVSQQNNFIPDNHVTEKRSKYNLEEREIISATHSFKQAVLLHLPKQRHQFTLEDKLSSPSDKTTCFKNVMSDKNNNYNSSKPMFSVSDDRHFSRTNNNYTENPTIPDRPLSSNDLCELSGFDCHQQIYHHDIQSEVKYESPIPLGGPSSVRHRHLSNSNYTPCSWQSANHNVEDLDDLEDFNLSSQFKESCADLWSHKLFTCLQEDDDAFPQVPSRSQSDTQCNRILRSDLTEEKKIQFTYTSNETFFVTAAPNTADAKSFHDFDSCYSEHQIPTEDSRSGYSIAVCPEVVESDSQEIFTNLSSEDDLISPISAFNDETENDDTSQSDLRTSSSSLTFIVFPKSSKPSRLVSTLPTNSLAECDLSKKVCPAANFPPIDSTSYTVLQIPPYSRRTPNCTSTKSSTPEPSPSTQESYDISLNTSSSPSDTSLSSFDTPPRPCNSIDSDSDGGKDDCFRGMEMTDKMAFKFMLDENGSEVEISVTLPFPVQNSELANIESPYMAAAVLQKAQELVLQNVGFMGSGDCGDHISGNGSSNRIYFEWVDQMDLCTNPGLPPLECSISMEELLFQSRTDTTRNIDKNQNGSEPGGICLDADSTTAGGQRQTNNNSRFISFLSYLFLCGWCRRVIKTAPENTSNCTRE